MASTERLLRVDREFRVVLAVFVGLMLLATASFVYGWWFDGSTPVGGSGWADQSMYRRVSERLAGGAPSGRGTTCLRDTPSS
jgi:hypothetical protein